MKYPYVYLKFVWRQLEFAFFGALASVGALFIFSNFGGHTMGLLGKTLGLAGMAAGGIAIASGLFVNKEKKLATLDAEFSAVTKEYEKEKVALNRKYRPGEPKLQKKLAALDEEYCEQQKLYEIERAKYLPKESKADLKHKRDIETLEVVHKMEMEKLDKEAVLMGTIPSASNVSVGSDSLICQNCGSQNSNGSKFCSSCGSEIITKKFCSQCGATLTPWAKFCNMCGAAI